MLKPTNLIHHAYKAPSNFDSISPAIFKASSIFYPNTAALAERSWHTSNAYTYGLHGTPTTLTLQQRIATLEGGQYSLLIPSGLAAISLVNLAFLGSGDEVLLPNNVYGPNTDMVKNVLGKMGITYQIYDPMQPEQLNQLITAKTKLIWLEAAGSVTLEFPDLITLVSIAKQHQLITVLDNTWGSGIAFNAFNLLTNDLLTNDLLTNNEPNAEENILSVDISMQALTKYASGGGDVLMGSVTTNNETLYKTLKATQQYLGINVAANDAEAILRSLPTIVLRYKHQDHTTRQLAKWLQQQPLIEKVLHPALTHSAGHAFWKQLSISEQNPQGAAAGIVSIMFTPQVPNAAVNAFCEQLKLFKIAYSWGGPVSLVMPYQLAQLRPNNMSIDLSSNRSTSNSQANTMLVRLSIGFEAIEDLKQDLAQALKFVNAQI